MEAEFPPVTMNMIGSFISFLLSLYTLLILARVLMSWFPLDTSNPTVAQIVQFIYGVTEPVLRPIRNLLPPMPFDLSPMIVILLISLLTRLF
jgi:YggT family protein